MKRIHGNDWARLMSHVERDPSSKCWHWTAFLDKAGYSRTILKGQRMTGHRAVWLASGRELVTGLEFDHLCRNRGCVNPEHLELVTHRENILRGDTICSRNPGRQVKTRWWGLRNHRSASSA